MSGSLVEQVREAIAERRLQADISDMLIHGPWTLHVERPGFQRIGNPEAKIVAECYERGGKHPVAEFIATNDPAAVLAVCAGADALLSRAVSVEIEGGRLGGFAEGVIELLAAMFGVSR